ncbi:DUF305 domain-containing protein [Georgenia faecalis]|uniref:DUF305 domain-containing protein n=1 Tax=Georgenia faecalis TaxID=2483799 RepID=UPI001F49E96B|nr:DUF305 domain-containing protein [Georgenia faecalis]
MKGRSPHLPEALMRRRPLTPSTRAVVAPPRGRARLAAGAALAVALLAGCGSAGDGPGDAPSVGTPTGSASADEVTVPTPSAGPSATASGAAVPEGRCEAPDPDEVASNEADVTFLRGMIPHHEQAVIMSETLLAAPGVPADVTTAAEAIIAAQGPEIDEMTTLLQGCGGEVAVGVHDHEAHGHGGDHEIHGMLTAAELDALAEAEGTGAARLYLEHMIAHHEGAVAMAREHGETGAQPEVLALSERIVADQEAEIDELAALLSGL